MRPPARVFPSGAAARSALAVPSPSRRTVHDNAGTIVGGAIDLAGGSVLDFGTLDSVALTQAAASDNFFGTIVNGLTILNGGGQGTLVGVPSFFLGDQTVDNSIIQAPGRYDHSRRNDHISPNPRSRPQRPRP